jgi:hypothetical protein
VAVLLLLISVFGGFSLIACSLCILSGCFSLAARLIYWLYNNMVCERNNYYNHKERIIGDWGVTNGCK